MLRRGLIGSLLISMLLGLGLPAAYASEAPEPTLVPYIPSQEELDAANPAAIEPAPVVDAATGVSAESTPKPSYASSSLLLPETPYLPSSSKNYKCVINLTSQIVTVYARDSKGAYTVPVRYMLCTTGADETPTPKGSFKASSRYRWYWFDEFKVWAQYAVRFNGAILFHSVLFSKQDESTVNSASVSRLGRKGSHGCVRLTVLDAKWVYENCPSGTVIAVENGEKQSDLASALKDTISTSAQKVVQDENRNSNISSSGSSSSKSSSGGASGGTKSNASGASATKAAVAATPKPAATAAPQATAASGSSRTRR